MNTFKKSVYIFLNLLIIATLGLSWMIYVSAFKFVPWYESCGTQFLVILMVSVPVLITLGVLLIILNTKYKIHKRNVRLPFYIVVGIGLPLVIDGGLSKFTIVVGTVLCIVFVCVTVIFMILHLKKIDYKIDEFMNKVKSFFSKKPDMNK